MNIICLSVYLAISLIIHSFIHSFTHILSFIQLSIYLHEDHFPFPWIDWLIFVWKLNCLTDKFTENNDEIKEQEEHERKGSAWRSDARHNIECKENIEVLLHNDKPWRFLKCLLSMTDATPWPEENWPSMNIQSNESNRVI